MFGLSACALASACKCSTGCGVEYLSGLPHLVWMRMIPGGPSADWTFWQFHSGGSVPGILGDVDLDVFRRDRDALDSL